jgi:SAM-dependent methyltransferase
VNSYKDDLARAYDADADRRGAMTPAKWRTDVTDTFAASARADGIRAVLELGCGTGQLASRLAGHGLDVTAIDLSPANVAVTRERGVNALVADFASLPFPADTFDAGFAMNSLLHVPSDEFPTVLTEIARVLRTGSPLVIVVWGGTDQQGPIKDEWLDPPRFFRTYTDEGLLALDTPGFRFSAFDASDVSEGAPDMHSQMLTLETL